MKITVYTTTDCQYCKQEKDYLAANKLTYEEKNLEINKEFLTEMLAISNNFAGTPVTRVEKDDGSIVVLKGFTKGEFDTTFGFAGVQTTPASEPTVVEPTPAPVAETPSASVPLSGTPADKAKSEELNAVMDKLEEKAAPEATPAPTEAPQVSSAPTDLSAEASAKADSTNPQPAAPSVPDFPDAAKTTA